MIGSCWTRINKQRSQCVIMCVGVCLGCIRLHCVQCVFVFLWIISHISVFMFRYLTVFKHVHIFLTMYVYISTLDRSHIQIRNMLTRHLGRSNCWSGGLRLWGSGRLIGGDYKPQSSDSVSGFDQTNTKARSQLQALTHVHARVHTSACAQRDVFLHTINM